MEKNLPLDQLGEALLTYIKKQSPYTLAQVAERTLGITYNNFQKRLSKNNIRLSELEGILKFLELEVRLEMGEMTFVNQAPTSIDYEDQLARRDKIVELQDKIIQLQEKLQAYNQKDS